FALNVMADAARGQGRPAEARQFLLAALEIARDQGYHSHLLETLVILAALLIAESDQTTGPAARAKQREALGLLDLAVEHPATLQVARGYALRLRGQIQDAQPEPSTEKSPTPHLALPELINRLLRETGR